MKTTSLILVFVLTALISGCGKEDKSTGNNSQIPPCAGEYVFTVTDTLKRQSAAGGQYFPDSSGRSYCVRFYSGKDSVSLKGDSVIGVLDTIRNDSLIYAIVNLFAGGRFIAWPDTAPSRAEYTVYGSGLPVVWSERGTLAWRE